MITKGVPCYARSRTAQAHGASEQRREGVLHFRRILAVGGKTGAQRSRFTRTSAFVARASSERWPVLKPEARQAGCGAPCARHTSGQLQRLSSSSRPAPSLQGSCRVEKRARFLHSFPRLPG